MSRFDKVLKKVLLGRSDRNIEFGELRALLEHLGFEVRIKDSHHIYTRADVPEILNIQPQGSQAKAYQVKQIRGVLLRYKLGELDE